MRPSDEPIEDEVEEVLSDEERQVLERPDVPDEVKTEIDERQERRREEDPSQ